MPPFGEVLRSLAAGTSWSLLHQLREEQMEADVLLGQGVVSRPVRVSRQ